MRRFPIVVGLLLGLGACSDPQFPANLQSSTDDSGDPAGEGEGDGTCAPTGWSCREIGDCSNGCGTNLDCISACQQEGCDESRETFGATTQCAQNRCLMDCIGGFNDACGQCMIANCTQEAAACEASTCPESCSDGPADDPTDHPADDTADAGTNPGSDDDDDVAEQQDAGDDTQDHGEPPPADPTCFDIYECARECMWDDCVEDCVDEGCDTARRAFTELLGCGESECDWECLTGFDADCVGCLMNRCETRWNACTDDNCAP